MVQWRFSLGYGKIVKEMVRCIKEPQGNLNRGACEKVALRRSRRHALDFKALLALGNPRPSTGQVPSARGRDGGREQLVHCRSDALLGKTA